MKFKNDIDRTEVGLNSFVMDQIDGDLYSIDIWREFIGQIDLNAALINIYNLRDDHKRGVRTFKEWIEKQMKGYEEFLSEDKKIQMIEDWKEFCKVFGKK